MTTIQPAMPNNVARQHKTHGGKHPPAATDAASFLELLAKLAPPADPTDPQAGQDSTDLLSSQPDKEAAKEIHGKDGKKDPADARRTDVRQPPGTGMLLPVPVLIGSLAPTNQPNATADSRTPIARRISAAEADTTGNSINLRARVAQGIPSAATTDPTKVAGTVTGETKIRATTSQTKPAAPTFTVNPPPQPDVATNYQGQLPPLAPTTITASAVPAVVQPTRQTVQQGVVPLVTNPRPRKGDLASPDTVQPDFVTGTPPTATPAPTVTVSPPTTAAMPPGMAATAQQIVAQAQLVRMGQTTEMRMRLRPPELGDVHVTLRRDGEGKMSIHFIPSTAEGESALRTNLHHLRTALDQHHSSQGADVSLGQRNSSTNQHHARHEQTHQEGWDDTLPSGSPVSPPASSVTRTTTSNRVGNGAVDYDA